MTWYLRVSVSDGVLRTSPRGWFTCALPLRFRMVGPKQSRSWRCRMQVVTLVYAFARNESPRNSGTSPAFKSLTLTVYRFGLQVKVLAKFSKAVSRQKEAARLSRPRKIRTRSLRAHHPNCPALLLSCCIQMLVIRRSRSLAYRSLRPAEASFVLLVQYSITDPTDE